MPSDDPAEVATAATRIPGSATSLVLADRYQLGALLGSGGMADVYRATDTVLLRPVAVKLLRDVSDPTQRERFVAEAHTLASLNHPNLVTLLDAGIDDERPYLVMEMVEGATLAQRLADGPVPSDEVKAMGHQLAAALASAHEQGVVHRDVKPSNVLLTGERSLLVDFGIARLIGSTDQHTRTGDTIGSPPYLAPEQVTSDPITDKADVYSFGLVLLEALTGERAYSGTPVEAAVARLHAPPALPTSLEPFWRSLLARMTDRDPAGRPSAAEVAVALGTPDSTPPASAPAGLVPSAEHTVTLEAPLASEQRQVVAGDPPRRGRRVVPLVLTLLLALGAGAAFLLIDRNPEPTTATEQQTTIPDGVPAAMRASLTALHRAIDAVADREPRLVPALDRVDRALSSRRFVVARGALEDIVGIASDARADGRIKRQEAARITEAADELLALLPGASPSTSEDPNPSANTKKPGPRPRPTPTPNQEPSTVPSDPPVSTPAPPAPSPTAATEPTTAPSRATDPVAPAADPTP